MNGKGDLQRPVNAAVWDTEYDRIFGHATTPSEPSQASQEADPPLELAAGDSPTSDQE